MHKRLNKASWWKLSTVGMFALAMVGPASGAPSPSPRQVILPWSVPLDQEGPESVFNHAAGLTGVTGVALGMGFSVDTKGGGLGDGISAAAAAGLGPFHIGAGFSRLMGADSLMRSDVGIALSLGSDVGLGMSWHGFSGEGALASGLDTYGSWSLSASMRPFRSLAVSLDLDRLNGPRKDGTSQPVHGRFGIGVRPGTERLTMGIEAGLEFADAGAWSVGGGLRTQPLGGFVLGAFARHGSDGVTSFGGTLSLSQGRASWSAGVSARAVEAGAGMPVVASSWLGVSSRPVPSLVLPADRVPVLTLSGSIPESPRPGLLSKGPSPLAHWLAMLEALAHDTSIPGLLLNLKAAPNWAQCWELRQAITRLQKAGKKVFVRLAVADMRAMYLASAADRIYLDPSGTLMLTGMSLTHRYFAGSLDKLGVRADFIRFEDHKSFPERLTRTGPSPPSAAQTRALLAHFDTAWMSAVGKGRNLDRTVLRGLLTRGPVTMKMAVSSGLVDAIADQDGIEKLISEELGVTVTLAKGYRSGPRGWRRWGTAPKIAIVPVIGTIATGKNRRAVPLFGGPVSGAATFAASLRALEDDASFAGVVIRVDSPGGGLLASDLMHRAIKRLAAKKPVVVSFGNTAASGGYYLAVASPWIMATPLTITGSVGVFAGKVDLSGLYQTLGIQTHTTTSQPGADVLGSHRSWTQGERERLKARLGDYYERFLTLVSEGRKLSMQATREVAGGRVFDGDRALRLRMVDGHGTLWDALQRVSREAELTEAFEFIYLPESSTFGRFLGKWPVSRATEGAWDVSWLSREVSDLGRMLAGLCLAAEGGIFALLPFEMRFQ